MKSKDVKAFMGLAAITNAVTKSKSKPGLKMMALDSYMSRTGLKNDEFSEALEDLKLMSAQPGVLGTTAGDEEINAFAEGLFKASIAVLGAAGGVQEQVASEVTQSSGSGLIMLPNG